MRILLSIFTVLLSCSAALAGETYAGFLTMGCGDRYLTRPGFSETWYVNLSVEMQQDLFRQAKVGNEFPWVTLQVVVDGKLQAKARPGYFTVHPQQLDIGRIVSARHPDDGASVGAAIGPPKPFKGLFLVGPESIGFVPYEQRDELWWAVAGKAGWDQILAKFRPAPDLDNNRHYYAEVEIAGRVGPPGAYGHMADYDREIAVDAFAFVRFIVFDEMIGTAALAGAKADIDLCKPQAR